MKGRELRWLSTVLCVAGLAAVCASSAVTFNQLFHDASAFGHAVIQSCFGEEVEQ